MDIKLILLFATLWSVTTAYDSTWVEFLKVHKELEVGKTIIVPDSKGVHTLVVSRIDSGWGNSVDAYLDRDIMSQQINSDYHYKGDIDGRPVRFSIDEKGQIQFFGEYTFSYEEGEFSLKQIERDLKRMNSNNMTCGSKREHDRFSKRNAVNEPLTPSNDNITYTIRVAVETDYHTFKEYNSIDKLTSNINAVFADINDVFFRELNIKVQVTKLFFYQNSSNDIVETDSNDASELLDKVSALYRKGGDPEKMLFFKNNQSVDAVLYLTTRGPFDKDTGGIAFTNTLCTELAIGVSQMYGPEESYLHVGIVSTVAHELGHILGSVHTHCYNAITVEGFDSTAVDHCENKEQLPDGKLCYRGARTKPSDGGSIMSYCGHASKTEELSFGSVGKHGYNSQRVGLVLRTRLEQAAAIHPSCMLRNGAQGDEDASPTFTRRKISMVIVVIMLALIILTFAGCAVYQVFLCKNESREDDYVPEPEYSKLELENIET